MTASIWQLLSNSSYVLASSYGILNVKQAPWNAKGDNLADDTDAIQGAIDAAKLSGLTVYIPPGTYRCGQLNIAGGSAFFRIIGSGKYSTVLKKIEDANFIEGGGGSLYGYEIGFFTMDCQETAMGYSRKQGLAIGFTSNIYIHDLYIKDFGNTGILIYAHTVGDYRNALVERCDVDGMNNGGAGMLIAQYDYSGFRSCTAKNITFIPSVIPGVGVQIKNECYYCFIVDCYSENCYIAFGCGNDGRTQYGVSDATFANNRGFECEFGWSVGGIRNCNFSGDILDLNYGTGSGIDIQSNTWDPFYGGDGVARGSVNNTWDNITIKRLWIARYGVRFRSLSANNSVTFALLDVQTDPGEYGSNSAAFFDGTAESATGVENNYVRVKSVNGNTYQYFDPWVSLNPGAGINYFSYDKGEFTYEVNVDPAVKLITLFNSGTRHLAVAPTTGTTTDVTEIRNGSPYQIIYVTTREDADTVTYKEYTGGTENLQLAGDFVANRREDVLTLMFNPVTNRWNEICRSNNL